LHAGGDGKTLDRGTRAARDRIETLEAALEGNNARPTVAIIGAGIGGVYLVAMLGLVGCKVRLHDIDDSRLKDLREAKGIQVEGPNGGFTKRGLQIATFPGNRIDAVFPRLAPLFPTAVSAKNVVYTGFVNANAMLHVANCVGNAGLIDRGGNYKFYAEGVTPMIGRLYEAINAERIAVADKLGAKVPDLAAWFELTYGVREKTLPETCRKLTFNFDGPYQATGTPKSFEHKYVSEDVPAGLIPMSAIGKAVDVPTPSIDAVIAIARIMAGSDFAANARTLDRLGLAGKNAEQIKHVMQDGF
jgi:opine dehydrogenase